MSLIYRTDPQTPVYNRFRPGAQLLDTLLQSGCGRDSEALKPTLALISMELSVSGPRPSKNGLRFTDL